MPQRRVGTHTSHKEGERFVSANVLGTVPKALDHLDADAQAESCRAIQDHLSTATVQFTKCLQVCFGADTPEGVNQALEILGQGLVSLTILSKWATANQEGRQEIQKFHPWIPQFVDTIASE